MPPYLFGILLLLSLIWGTSFLFIKILLENFTPASIAFFRSLFGIVILLIIMLIKKEKLFSKETPWGKLIAVGIFNTSIPWALIAFSEMKLSSGLASILNATTSLWTIVVGIIVFGMTSTISQWLGIVLGFIGILVLTNIDWSTFTIADPIGFIAMISATLFYAFAGQISKRYLQGLTVLQISFGTLVFGAIGSLILALLTGPINYQALFNINTIGAYVVLGIFGSGIAYLLYYTLIQKGSAEFAALVTYVVPLFAVLWGALFLDEILSYSLLIGALLILTGVYISGRKKATTTKSSTSIQQLEPEQK